MRQTSGKRCVITMSSVSDDIKANRIKPIETRYKGYRFRSRLEARWAVFFDTLGIEWQYEPEGYEKEGIEGNVLRYLPDFFFPKSNTYAEVKGSTDALRALSGFYEDFLDFGSPLPHFTDSRGSLHGLVILGNIPDKINGITLHPIIQHHKGLDWSWAVFEPTYHHIDVVDPFDNMLRYFTDKTPDEWSIEYLQIETPLSYPTVKKAYQAARSARFEHGETP